MKSFLHSLQLYSFSLYILDIKTGLFRGSALYSPLVVQLQRSKNEKAPVGISRCI